MHGPRVICLQRGEGRSRVGYCSPLTLKRLIKIPVDFADRHESAQAEGEGGKRVGEKVVSVVSRQEGLAWRGDRGSINDGLSFLDFLAFLFV